MHTKPVVNKKESQKYAKRYGHYQTDATSNLIYHLKLHKEQ